MTNFAALEWKLLPHFFADLSKIETTTSSALQFLILTASRTSMVLGCLRKEIHIDKQLWCIPGKRMKARYEHTVPPVQ